MAVERLKRYESPSVDHIPAVLMQAIGKTSHSETRKHINCILNKEELAGWCKGSCYFNSL
jgi:hypothetical protein